MIMLRTYVTMYRNYMYSVTHVSNSIDDVINKAISIL